MTTENVPQDKAKTAEASGVPRWVYLKDLVLPPEMVREVEDYCRGMGRHTAAERARVEQDVKLGHFFGGQDVAYMRTPEGPAYWGSGDLTPEEFSAALGRLTREERCRITVWTQDRWGDPTSQLGRILDVMLEEMEDPSA